MVEQPSEGSLAVSYKVNVLLSYDPAITLLIELKEFLSLVKGTDPKVVNYNVGGKTLPLLTSFQQ